MVNNINSQINSIQMFNASNAFKNAQAKPEKKEEIVEKESTVNNDVDKILSNIDVKDVKMYAAKIGENNLSQDDICYGITSGRSVIADWVV